MPRPIGNHAFYHLCSRASDNLLGACYINFILYYIIILGSPGYNVIASVATDVCRVYVRPTVSEQSVYSALGHGFEPQQVHILKKACIYFIVSCFE